MWPDLVAPTPIIDSNVVYQYAALQLGHEAYYHESLSSHVMMHAVTCRHYIVVYGMSGEHFHSMAYTYGRTSLTACIPSISCRSVWTGAIQRNATRLIKRSNIWAPLQPYTSILNRRNPRSSVPIIIVIQCGHTRRLVVLRLSCINTSRPLGLLLKAPRRTRLDS